MGKKILLADDSITIQKVIELTFSDEDFEVVTVGNGRLAVERVQDVASGPRPLRHHHAGEGRLRGLRLHQEDPALSHIPVLLLTGAFEPFDQERAARVGCDGFLAKPFEPQTLIAKVKDLLARGEARGSARSAPPPAAPPAAAASRPPRRGPQPSRTPVAATPTAPSSATGSRDPEPRARPSALRRRRRVRGRPVPGGPFAERGRAHAVRGEDVRAAPVTRRRLRAPRLRPADVGGRCTTLASRCSPSATPPSRRPAPRADVEFPSRSSTETSPTSCCP